MLDREALGLVGEVMAGNQTWETINVTGGGVETLPIVVYNRIRYMLSPEINAIATIVMGFSIGLLAIGQAAMLIRRRKERSRS